MRIVFLLGLLFATTQNISAQPIHKSGFIINGNIIGRDSGTIILMYNDVENKRHSDIAIIKNGKFKFSGTVNRICDAYLWTDLKNKNFSDETVIRFLLEPGNITISYTETAASSAIIEGSKAEIEREKWNKKKAFLIIPNDQLINIARLLFKLSKTDSSKLIKDSLNMLTKKIDSLVLCIKELDLAFIRAHKNSYLSGFLLSNYKRKLPIDTLQMYYNLLTDDVAPQGSARQAAETSGLVIVRRPPLFASEGVGSATRVATACCSLLLPRRMS